MARTPKPGLEPQDQPPAGDVATPDPIRPEAEPEVLYAEILPDPPLSAEPVEPAPRDETPEPAADVPGLAGPEIVESTVPESRAPEPAASALPHSGAPPRRTVSPAPLLVGGVLAAGLGFALAQVVPEGWPLAGIEPLQTRVAAQETALRGLAAELEAAKTALAAQPVPDLPDLAPIEGRLAALDGALAELAARPAPADPRLDDLATRLTTLESLPPATGDGAGDPAALAAVMRDLAALRTEMAAQKAAQDRIAADLAAAAEAASAARAEAEAEAARLKAAAEAEAQATLMRAAAARVLAAIDSGAEFSQPLDVLAAGGLTLPEDLLSASGGVATLSDLLRDFSDPARAALDASLRAATGGDVTDRLGNFLRTAAGVRSLTPREGDDPDAVLSRAEDALRRADIAAALAEISTLPEPGQAALTPWTARAATRLRATEAATALAASLEG